MTTSTTLRIGLVQGRAYGSPASFDVDANRGYYLDLLKRCCNEGRPDVVLLPEVFTAPYIAGSRDLSHFDLSETIPGPSTDAVGEIAREYGCYVFVPLFERVVDGIYYDSTALVGPDGEIVPAVSPRGEQLSCARKVHIPSIEAKGTRADEKFWFRPGEALANFQTPWGLFGCLICYDRSFPEAWRSLVLAGACVVFVPVASYGFRKEMFLAEMRTRASENGVFAAAANRVGLEDVTFPVDMFGQSCVIGPTGDVVALAEDDEAVLTVEVDLADIAAARQAVPYFRDRRTDLYQL